jgi:2-hydroxychromene-2-carboxylate isomerase
MHMTAGPRTSDDPALATEADALTREAIARKVFGAPFFLRKCPISSP